MELTSPLSWEINLIKANPVAKILFFFFYPMMYVTRGAAKKKALSSWDNINLAFTLTTDFLFGIFVAFVVCYTYFCHFGLDTAFILRQLTSFKNTSRSMMIKRRILIMES